MCELRKKEGKRKEEEEDLKKGKRTRAKCIHMSPVKATDVHMRGGAEKQMERERQNGFPWEFTHNGFSFQSTCC